MVSFRKRTSRQSRRKTKQIDMEAGSKTKIIFYKKVLEKREPQRKRTTDRNRCKLQAAKGLAVLSVAGRAMG
ncbi:hypothetical protein DWY99_02790 [[Clostridium] leptum]|uniref:Uncharacterized protein n=1 Tax=[Clostridium] leptum TaxID=1535 RepID=A0A412AZP9_9FIRM|nr:hypothetical protein DWY99_02790 [[Clostridium] leptum]